MSRIVFIDTEVYLNISLRKITDNGEEYAVILPDIYFRRK